MFSDIFQINTLYDITRVSSRILFSFLLVNMTFCNDINNDINNNNDISGRAHNTVMFHQKL